MIKNFINKIFTFLSHNIETSEDIYFYAYINRNKERVILMKDEIIRNGQIIHHDKDGSEYVIDEAGNHIPPLQIEPCSYSSDRNWPNYDISQGH